MGDESAAGSGASHSRFFALDSVRATAMLLGVLYHAILFGGGMMAMFGGERTAASWLMDWIHSYRMPLFFLISGFFSCMMFTRYGVGRYLARRWQRIAIPFLLALFTLALLRHYNLLGGFGPGPGRRPGPDALAGGGPGPQQLPSEAVFPPGEGFQPGDGPQGGGPPMRGPGMREFGEEGFPPMDEAGFGPMPGPGGGGGPPGPPGGPWGRGSPVAQRLFGSFAPSLTLQHLWFLAYLLVFATVAPLFVFLVRRVVPGSVRSWLGRGAMSALRWGWAPMVVAMVSVPGLLLSGTEPGRPPGGAATIFGLFPDVLFRYDADWPYFFSYFLCGWWLYHLRDGLGQVGRSWLPAFGVGVGLFVMSAWAGGSGAPFPFGPKAFSWGALGRHYLFGCTVAFTAFGLMGFFQRYLDRPTRTSRYLADTAFWVYLVHQDLLNSVVLGWVRPWGLPALAQALAATLMTMGMALVAYEILVRRTPLGPIVGPPRAPTTVRPTAVHGTHQAMQ